MSTNGVMEEIRGLLAQGKSSGEVIALGHARSSVYKIQRQMRKQGNGAALAPGVESTPAQPGTSELQQRIAILEAELAEAQGLRSQLDQAGAIIEELIAETGNMAGLEETAASLGEEVRAWEGKAAEAQQALGEITGIVTSDDLLGKIFSSFCIGK